jgi:HPt (histidine-containing phosphotransfer) domain-containing protein
MLGGDEAKCLVMLNKFRAQHGGDVASVRQLISRGDVQGAVATLHLLCGIAGFLQAKPLALAASHCEAALQEGQAAQWPELLEAMDRAMQATKTQIQGYDSLRC